MAVARRRLENLWRTTIGFVAVAIALVSLTAQLANVWELKDKLFIRKESDLPARIEVLTKSLNTAAVTIGQIEDQIKQRQLLVTQLQHDAETASKLSALNKEQLDAVASVLRSEIKSDQSQNFWSTQLLAFFYAALGVALSEGYRFVIRWRLRRKLEPEE